MAGRKTKLNDTVQKQIVKLLKTGVTVADACQASGIAERTYYLWLERAENGDADYLQFMQAVTQAQVDAKVVAIDTLRNAMTPYQQTSKTVDVFTEKRVNPYGKEYDYVRKTERETVTTMAGDYRAAIEYLKRRYPGEWSEKLQLDVNINVEIVVKTIKALEDAGVDVQEFFEKAKQLAEQRRANPSG